MTPDLWVEVVKAVVWPVTTVALIIIFRKNILLIGKKVGKIKYGDFEAEFRETIKEQSAVERQVSIAASHATDSPEIDTNVAGELEDGALREVEKEFGEITRHVSFLERQDLTFDAVAIDRGDKSRATLFEVVITGNNMELPEAHFSAVEARFRALLSAIKDRDIQGEAKLVFLVVTSLKGAQFISFESKIRGRFERRHLSDVRLYSKDVLLESEPDRKKNEKGASKGASGT